MNFAKWLERRSARELAVEKRMLEVALADSRADRDYWKDKAEKLLDAALFHRGEISAPTFSKPEKRSQDPIASFMSALRVTEINAQPAEPVTPMK